MPEGGAVRCVSSGCLSNGAEGQNRTVDTSLFRAVLYQLSYLGTDVTAPHLAEAEKSRNFAPIRSHSALANGPHLTKMTWSSSTLFLTWLLRKWK